MNRKGYDEPNSYPHTSSEHNRFGQNIIKEDTMEYLNNEDLREKDPSNTRGSGVSAFIKETLEQIPEGQGLAMSDLAKEIASQFELPVQQSYVRIGNVLKRKSHAHFVRLQDEKGKTFISRVVNLDNEVA